MGNGFMSRPSSADSAWGRVEETKDEELYQPIKNYYGEVVGWRERTESEKLRRREINAEFAMLESDEEEEDQSEKSSSPTPPPPPPPKKPVKVVIKESSDIEEEEENPFNKSLDRTPSAKSVMVSSPAQHGSHSSRVKDKFRPSLLPAENFNKDSAAGRLYRALHGETRTDVATVIEILTSHSAQQRKKIGKSYKFNHNKILRSDLEHKLRGDTRQLMVGLVQDEAEFCVEALRLQIDGDASINDIIGLLAWKDSDILDGINKIYTAKYNTDLEEDLLSACEEKYHPVIQICMSENRDDQEDESQIMKSVKVLSRAVEEHDKESFKMNLNYILCCRPWDILPDILDKFEIINEGKDLSHYMKKMLGKRIGEAFMPLLYILDEPSAFYAEELFESVDGSGTDEEKLTRIFILRAEIDLVSIDHVYKKMFGKKLEKVVRDETSGQYRDSLEALLHCYKR